MPGGTQCLETAVDQERDRFLSGCLAVGFKGKLWSERGYRRWGEKMSLTAGCGLCLRSSFLNLGKGGQGLWGLSLYSTPWH